MTFTPTQVPFRRVYIGADHGGWQLKESLKPWLQGQGLVVHDQGAAALNPDDDYPDAAVAVARAVAADPAAVGILLCRSSAGMTMAANKIAGARAVSIFEPAAVLQARQHTDANVLSLAADDLDVARAQAIITPFLATPFSADERHQRRLAKIAAVEEL